MNEVIMVNHFGGYYALNLNSGTFTTLTVQEVDSARYENYAARWCTWLCKKLRLGHHNGLVWFRGTLYDMNNVLGVWDFYYNSDGIIDLDNGLYHSGMRFEMNLSSGGIKDSWDVPSRKCTMEEFVRFICL